VAVGEQVVTSGMDKIFPRDVPVGTVIEVKAGTPFKQIRVRPTVKFDRLEEVIVLLTQQPLEFKKDAEAQGAQAGAQGSQPATQNSAAGKAAVTEKP
jgi:rod shape-determining protein MreC